MKTEKNILTAFILNLSFAVFELAGGIVTGSVAIISDAVHDAGDAMSIGLSLLLERKSKQQPDEEYTYGYARYSVLGGLVMNLILLLGSAVMLYHAVCRIIAPVEIHYHGMILFAIVGVCVNFGAAYFTRGGTSLNQKAVNLHMLEDVLGWIVVLVGAVVMRYTGFALIDPLMCIGVSVFLLIHAVVNLKEITELFLEKVPCSVAAAEIKKHLEEIDGILEVHHIHLWSLDGQKHLVSMHIVTDSEPYEIKTTIRSELREHGIGHVTIETEASTESCLEKHCHIGSIPNRTHGHSHHQHRH